MNSRAITGKALPVSLWTAQILVAILLLTIGLMKLATPIPQLALKLPWTGQVSPSFLYFTAITDLLGAMGLIVPAITKIKPWLTPLTAVGICLLMITAIIFHVSRGESSVIGFNFIVIAICVFIAWGDYKKGPFASDKMIRANGL